MYKPRLLHGATLILLVLLVMLIFGCSDDSEQNIPRSKDISQLKMPDEIFEQNIDEYDETSEDSRFDHLKEYTPEEYKEIIKRVKISEEIEEIKKYYDKSVSVKGPGNAGISVMSIKIGDPKAVIRLVPTLQTDGKITDVEVRTATVTVKVTLRNISEFNCKSVAAQLYLYDNNNVLLAQEAIYAENISPQSNREITLEIRDLPTGQSETAPGKLIEFGNSEIFILQTLWTPK